MSIFLTAEQEKLRKLIEEKLVTVKFADSITDEQREQAFSIMKDAAHTLHMQLEPKPTHRASVIKNREMSAEDPDFYNHIHTVEDLLAYLSDPTINNDIEDITLSDDFSFPVYSTRWGHHDTYKLTRTEKGWYVKTTDRQGEDKLDDDEMKTLYAALNHDSISFPINLDTYFFFVWKQAREKGLSHEQVQDMINRIADWVSLIEKSAPKDLLN